MQVTISNFKSIQSTSLDIRGGLVLLDGHSGVGKSTILNAIVWALYGPRSLITSRNISTKSNKSISVDIALAGMLISRKTRPERLTVEMDGKAYEDEYAQQAIDAMFGPYDIYSVSSYIPQDNVCQFISMSGTARYEIMERILFSKGSSINRQVKADIAATQKDISRLEIEATSIRHLYEENLEQLPAKFRTECASIDCAPLEANLAVTTRAADAIQSTLDKLAKTLQAAVESRPEIERLSTVCKETQSEIAGLEGRRQQIVDKMVELKKSIPEQDADVQALQMEKSRLEAILSKKQRLQSLADFKERCEGRMQSIRDSLAELPQDESRDLLSTRERLAKRLDAVRSQLADLRELKPQVQRKMQLSKEMDEVSREMESLASIEDPSQLEADLSRLSDEAEHLQSRVRILTKVKHYIQDLTPKQWTALQAVGVNLPLLPSPEEVMQMEEMLVQIAPEGLAASDAADVIQSTQEEMDEATSRSERLRQIVSGLSGLDPTIAFGGNYDYEGLKTQIAATESEIDKEHTRRASLSHQLQIAQNGLSCPHCGEAVALNGDKLVASLDTEEIERQLSATTAHIADLKARREQLRTTQSILRIMEPELTSGRAQSLKAYLETTGIVAGDVATLVKGIKDLYARLRNKATQKASAIKVLKKFESLLDGGLDFDGKTAHIGKVALMTVSEVVSTAHLIRTLTKALPKQKELDRTAELSTRLDEIQSQRSRISQSLDECKRTRYYRDKLQSRFDLLRREASDLETTEATLRQRLHLSERDRIDDVINRLASEEVAIRDELSGLDARLGTMSQTLRQRKKLEDDLKGVSEELEGISEQMASINVEDGAEGDLKARIAGLSADIEAGQKASKMREEVARLEASAADMDARLKDRRTRLEEAQDRLGQLKVDEDGLRKDMDDATGKLKAQQSMCERLRGELEEARKHNAYVDRYRHLQPHRDKLHLLEKELRTASERLSRLRRLSAVVEETRAAVMARAFQVMSARATQLAQIMFSHKLDSAVAIEMSPVTKTKTTNKVKAEVGLQIRYNGIEYTSLQAMSGGERARVSLAVMLSINSILPYCRRLILLDEVMSSLDEDHRDSTVHCLRRFTDQNETQVISVLHECDRGLFDAVLRVR